MLAYVPRLMLPSDWLQFDKGQLWSKFLHFDRMIAKTLDERCRKAAIRLCEPTRGGRCLRPWGPFLVDEGYRIFNLTILWEIRHDAMVRGALRQLRQILR